MKILKSNRELSNCPFCGGKPELNRVGDNKQYLVYICSECHSTPVLNCQARCTESGARKIWNKRCKEQEA